MPKEPTYFGAQTPVTAHFARIKKSFGVLMIANVALVICFVLLYQLYQSQPDAGEGLYGSGIAQAGNFPGAGMIEILVAKEDVSEGTMLDHKHFTSKTVREDMVPAGVLLAADKIYVVGQFANAPIAAGIPLRPENIISRRSTNPFYIPPNYRATTININARSGVEGFAKPDTRVDVLWFHTDKHGNKKLATIVRSAKVLSVGGMTGGRVGKHGKENPAYAPTSNHARAAGTTATLLVTEKDAQVIELARNLGDLSLTLVGDESAKKRNSGGKSFVTIRDIVRNARGGDSDSLSDGVMTQTDPYTGKQTKFLLNEDGWQEVQEEKEEEVAQNTSDNRKSNWASQYSPTGR